MSSASSAAHTFSANRDPDIKINNEAPVYLRCTSQAKDRPHFTMATLLPGRGMNTFALQCHRPNHGHYEMLETLPMDKASELFSSADPFGNLSFKCGGAFLIPYGNRIRGPLNPDGLTLKAQNISGRTLDLPANWKGQNPGAELHAMHGLILKSKVTIEELQATENEAMLQGQLECGDFGHQWPSSTILKFRFSLRADKFSVQIHAMNVGKEVTPIGIGWHPYFSFPSGKREQVRLEIPAKRRALSNNLDDVFPTGEIVEVKDSEYDFSKPGGAALGKTFFDDAFLDFTKESDERVSVKLIDPLAAYGVKVSTTSPPLSNFQFYAPDNKAFTSIEPQVNMPEPFSPIWGPNVNRGMCYLQPGESLEYAVDVELFTP